MITIALKKTSKDGLKDKIVQKTIQLWTRSKYFHVEVIIKDKWISTNPEAGAVYIRNLEDLRDNYDYFNVDVREDKIEEVMAFLKNQIGKKYDYWGLLFSTVLTMNLEDRNKWFCSELVAEALRIFGYQLPKNSNEMTPADIHEFILSINTL